MLNKRVDKGKAVKAKMVVLTTTTVQGIRNRVQMLKGNSVTQRSQLAAHKEESGPYVFLGGQYYILNVRKCYIEKKKSRFLASLEKWKDLSIFANIPGFGQVGGAVLLSSSRETAGISSAPPGIWVD